MAKIAKKTNPKLWEQAKREALAAAVPGYSGTAGQVTITEFLAS